MSFSLSRTPALILGALLFVSALPLAAAPGLVADKDTVIGIELPHWEDKTPWVPANYVRVRNVSNHPITFDSLRSLADTITYRGSRTGTPLDLAFAVRTYAGGMQTRDFVLRFRPPILFSLAAGDSADIGLFEIGRFGFLVKTSAAERRYVPGAAIVQPLVFKCGSDSLVITLKATVMEASYGSGIVAPQVRGAWSTSGVTGWRADGRMAPRGRREAGMAITEREPGSFSRRP